MSFAISNVGGSSAPQIMSGASGYSAPSAKMSKVFDQIDVSGSGAVTNSQFQQSFGKLNAPANFQTLGPEAIFSQIDPAGTGSVSKSDFVSGMVQLMKSLSAKSSSAADSSSATNMGSSSLNESLKAFQQLTQKASTVTENSIDAWF